MPETASAATETVTGWGRTNPATVTVVEPRDIGEMVKLISERGPVLARGLGRSYGDAAQLDGGTVIKLDRFTAARWLDRAHGVLRVGGGVSLAQLIDRFVPQGWFIPVSPGTRNVTVGGAIAADIHGKNHHRDGSWCNFVDSISIAVADGHTVTASRDENGALFWATCGGMGLTGIIVEATLRMAPIASSTVLVHTQRTQDLTELMDIMKASDDEHRFSVAWVDLMHRSGRGVLTRGDFAVEGPLRSPGVPSASLPPVPLPRLARPPLVRAFNEMWFRKAPAQPRVTEESITAFFHPLDAIRDWNRIYGAKGFHQWQIALPEGSEDLLLSIASQLYDADAPAFFAVLKRFGPGNDAPLSFPIAGWTLALDLPAGDDDIAALLDRLDDIVADNGGRIYLAKDARLRPELLARMYPRLDTWKRTRAAWDPSRAFDSDLARRMHL